MGRRPDTENTPQTLPFEATLAFVFRNSGGKETAIEAARLVSESDPRFKRFIHAWDTASFDTRQSLKLEDLCAAADLTSSDFIGSVIPALWRRNVDMGKIIAAVSHPRIVEATVEHAQSFFGGADRKMLHEHMGFLPTKQGMQVNINNSNQSLNVGSASDTSALALPSFEEDIDSVQKHLRGKQPTMISGATEAQATHVPGSSAPPSPPDASQPALEAEFVDV